MSVPVDKYMLCFYVPTTHTTTCVSAIFKTGAGTWPGGLYAETCFVSNGTGQFKPMEGASPNIGVVGELEKVEEHKIEVICAGKECARKAVQALKEAHPYEVVAHYLIKSEDL